MDFFQKLMFIAALVFLLWLFFGIVFIDGLNKRNQLEYLCKMYTVNGNPDYIIVNRIKSPPISPKYKPPVTWPRGCLESVILNG